MAKTSVPNQPKLFVLPKPVAPQQASKASGAASFRRMDNCELMNAIEVEMTRRGIHFVAVAFTCTDAHILRTADLPAALKLLRW